MQIRQQMLLTLVNSAVIVWIIWIVGGGREKEEEAIGGAEARKGGEGERVHKEKVGTDVKVMQVLRKLQASQVKHLNQAVSNRIKHPH